MVGRKSAGSLPPAPEAVVVGARPSSHRNRHWRRPGAGLAVRTVPSAPAGSGLTCPQSTPLKSGGEPGLT